ncbi:metalloprotease TldD [Paraburkholderia caballeronis]|uniref:metalloprotease TldD n=1 Tax=Paraburkholderia caballeronis TaxID=416943 RepID=UPI001065A716|nr:metalloprotease TldD [Paraburkholderia caballeronis]TDV19699.1 microcin-processing peptidase 2 [Paraburkholderia caballeronis]TDV22298.1 microcin-processing peptidase 2 [Paraburkholderia caballeronis]TDV29202.1 microcin-processing peptidase 2 [Paraburkholderia caballeronis]
MNLIEPGLGHLAVATDILLAPYGHDETVLGGLLAGVFAARDCDYADLYFQFTRNEAWTLENGIVQSGRFSIDQGVGVRAVSGDRTAFAYSDDLTLAAIRQAAAATTAIAKAGGGAQKVRPASAFRPVAGRDLYRGVDPLASLDAAAKVEILTRVEQMARSRDPRIQQVMASLAGTYDVMLVARSDGVIAADVRPMVRLSVMVIAAQDGRRGEGAGGGGGRFDYGPFSDDVLAGYVDEAVHVALTNLDARPAPAGAMTVVLGPGLPGVLLHEAVGHGLEGDAIRKGSSAFAGRLGERVAAAGVTVVDDGTLPEHRGSLGIDDEGNPTQCTTLIEDGILTGYLHDTLSARLLNVPVTGNARRESYATLPMPRMTNTYMLNGDKDPREIVESVQHGLYAAKFGGGQVDITTGNFVFSASEAYLIEDGRITYPVKGATLIGSGPQALKYVSMIGNDMALDRGVGVCGKLGQSVPVGLGQPTLRIDQMTVGGTR